MTTEADRNDLADLRTEIKRLQETGNDGLRAEIELLRAGLHHTPVYERHEWIAYLSNWQADEPWWLALTPAEQQEWLNHYYEYSEWKRAAAFALDKRNRIRERGRHRAKRRAG